MAGATRVAPIDPAVLGVGNGPPPARMRGVSESVGAGNQCGLRAVWTMRTGGSLAQPPRSVAARKGDASLVLHRRAARPVFHLDIVAPRWPEVDLPGTGDLLLPVEEHLLPLGNPTGGSRDGEENREHVHRELHRLVD